MRGFSPSSQLSRLSIIRQQKQHNRKLLKWTRLRVWNVALMVFEKKKLEIFLEENFKTYRIVQGEEAIRQSSMASINATVQVPRLKMTRVHIPFTFRLLETGNNSYEGKWLDLFWLLSWSGWSGLIKARK